MEKKCGTGYILRLLTFRTNYVAKELQLDKFDLFVDEHL